MIDLRRVVGRAVEVKRVVGVLSRVRMLAEGVVEVEVVEVEVVGLTVRGRRSE